MEKEDKAAQKAHLLQQREVTPRRLEVAGVTYLVCLPSYKQMAGIQERSGLDLTQVGRNNFAFGVQCTIECLHHLEPSVQVEGIAPRDIPGGRVFNAADQPMLESLGAGAFPMTVGQIVLELMIEAQKKEQGSSKDRPAGSSTP